MAKWKVATQLAVAMREAERQAEIRRVIAEQRRETIKNGKILRKLARSRVSIGKLSADVIIRNERMYTLQQQDNLEDVSNLRVAKSTYHQRLDAQNQATILKNIERLDLAREERKSILSAIEMVHVKTHDVEQELKETKLKLKKVMKVLSNRRVVNDEKVDRRAEVTEQNIGRQLAENRRLMYVVDHLEMERDKVLYMHGSLVRDLEDLSKQLAGFTEKAKETYEQRDTNRRNMVKLAEHLEKNTASFESDMQLLQFKINCLKRMERFMTTKNKYRPDLNRERRLKSRSQLSASERDNLSYHHLVSEIKHTLKDNDLRRAIKVFIELEEENYMLFKNISETREACQSLELEKEQTRAHYTTMRKADLKEEQENIARKMELKEKIENCKKQDQKTEELTAAADKIIQTYIDGILTIMDKLGYNDEDIVRLSGVFNRVEERNVNQFLAEIERYVNQLYELKTAADYVLWDQARKMEMTPTNPEILPPRLTHVQRVVVVPPVHEEADETEEHVLHGVASVWPLESSELLRYVEEGLDLHVGDKQEGSASSSNQADTGGSIGELPDSSLGSRRKFSVDVF